MTDSITKQGIRILRPQEFEKLLRAIPKQYHRTIVKTALFTGMRWRELIRFKDHPEWLSTDSNTIHLPDSANLKEKCKQSERWIRLTRWGKDTVQTFLLNDFTMPSRQAMSENLKRWGNKADLDTNGLCLKTFRKTWESWLVSIYPEKLPHIFLSQGHTEMTALKHYLNLPFNSEDKKQIEEYVRGIEW